MPYIKLPDAVWNCRLNATELMVYIALQKHANAFGRCTVKHSTVARLVGASAESVLRATHGLADKGLLFIHERRNKITGNRVANGYTVETPAGGFTKLPANIFACALNKSVFKVYAYLLKCRGETSLEAVPSLSQMVSALHMSKRTIVDAVKYLDGHLFIQKTGYARKTDNRIGHNRHRVLTPRLRAVLLLIMAARQKAQKKIRATPSQRATRNANRNVLNFTYNILQVVKKCKGVLCKLFSRLLI